jgi:hypothetical protein
LSTLISLVSNNQAPAELQTAFTRLLNDLPAPSTTTPAPSGGSPSVTLLGLLNRMQQNLGYSTYRHAASVGSILNAQG